MGGLAPRGLIGKNIFILLIHKTSKRGQIFPWFKRPNTRGTVGCYISEVKIGLLDFKRPKLSPVCYLNSRREIKINRIYEILFERAARVPKPKQFSMR